VDAIDLTPAMIDLAKLGDEGNRIRFAVGGIANLGFADRSFDIVTGSYAIRNAPDLDVALREIHRVMKPGGVAAFLDFSKPRGRLAQDFQYHLSRCWGGFWGALLHGNARIHGYISASLRDFPDDASLAGIFESHRFTRGLSRPFLGGMMRLHVLHKTDFIKP
jgi:ubiquinone/menaquinone biosynthesis C-methylase UbiE